MLISNRTARRYLLGRQGLWPGRRWTGKAGVDRAIRAIEALQLDPVQIVARSHDLVLWSRVAEYEPSQLNELLFQERRFFDYGSHLDVYPIEELPFWRLHMQRRAEHAEQTVFAMERADVIERVRQEIWERGPLASREITGGAKIDGYRGSTETTRALYHLWFTGELMTEHRRGFERVHQFREQVAPPEWHHAADEAQAERHFAEKALRQHGLATVYDWARFMRYAVQRSLDRKEALIRLQELIDADVAARVQIEDVKGDWFMPAAELPLLAELEAGRVPAVWTPARPGSAAAVNFLSPLDNLVHRREPTRLLFGFDYLWEIYKPAHQRKWGAYTLPVLYEDRLVARVEPKMERQTGTFRLDQIWWEDEALAGDPAFVAAFAHGLEHFARFHGARQVVVDALEPTTFRDRTISMIALN